MLRVPHETRPEATEEFSHPDNVGRNPLQMLEDTIYEIQM
jgi:hypothetical protein